MKQARTFHFRWLKLSKQLFIDVMIYKGSAASGIIAI